MYNFPYLPGESFVYPITFHFNTKGEWRYKSEEEIYFEFSVTDHNGIRRLLPQKEATQSSCTLGVHLTPDGNNLEMVQTLTKKRRNGKLTSKLVFSIDMNPGWQ